MAANPVPLGEEPAPVSQSHVSSSGNLQVRIDLSVLDDDDDDEDFPLIPCCTAMFLLLLSAGLIGTGSIRAYYLKSTSAGVPFWLLGRQKRTRKSSTEEEDVQSRVINRRVALINGHQVRGVRRARVKVLGGPKRPKCAFFYYASDRRPSLREEQPGLSAMDTSRILGDEWNKLTEEEKTPYQELAQKDRERYNEEKGEVAQ